MTPMNEPSQFELFPGASQQAAGVRAMPLSLRDLTISLENIIVLCIIFIMSVVLFFSLGVERGKRITFPPLAEAQASYSAPAVPVQVPEVNSPAAVNTQAVQGVKEELIINAPQETSEETIAIPQDIQEALDKQYTIQVASFKQEKFAREEANLLKKKGFDSFVVPKGSHSIVCVGKFDGSNKAKTFSSRLKNKYKDCLVRRL